MPKTVIVRQTWRCPTCDSEWDSAVCDGKPCTHCGAGVVRPETNPARCGTLTIMGEEDIEPEIERENAERGRLARPVLTVAEAAAYRAKRRQDIALAIVEARKREHKP